MPRKREGTVKESLEELRELEERYRGKPEEVRITVLRLLKEDDDRGIEDVASLVGYSKPTVKRWWRTYREGGIDALFEIAGGTRRVPIIDEDLNVLKQKLMAGEFRGVNDVREWIDLHTQSAKTSGNERHPANRIGDKARANGGRQRTNGLSLYELKAFDDQLGLAERLIKFLTSLPTVPTIKEWTDTIRAALQAFLGDVDRVSISVNARCELLNPQRYQPNMVVSQSVQTGAKVVNRIAENADEDRNDEVHLERVLASLRGNKFPFSTFRPPVWYVYHHLDTAFLGVVVLWRERSKPPISESTLLLMEQLSGFIEYILSDFAARHQATNPVEHVFDQALEGLSVRTGLTMQERRIMILQLLGLSYEEIATTLSISLNTVRYHLRSIYQKTGTHSQAELFAKYFTPRFDPEQAPG